MNWIGTAVAALVLLLSVSALASAAPGEFRTASPSSAAFHPPPPTSKNVTVGKQPSAIAEDTATGEVFVPNNASNTVSVINGTTVKKTIPVGKGPSSIAFDPSNGLLYVVNGASKNASVISGSTLKVVGTITGLSGYSGGAFYDPGTGAVYLLSAFGTSVYSHLARLPTASPFTTVTKTITLGKDAVYVTYDPATSSLVSSNTQSNNLSIVSTSNTVKTVALKVGAAPAWSAYSSKNKDLYVADEGTFTGHSPRTGNISVLDSSNAITKTLSVGGIPLSLTFDPHNGEMYAVNESLDLTNARVTNSSVFPISSSNTVKSPIKVGQGAFLVTYDATNFNLYVAEEYSNATAVIKGSSDTLQTTVTTTGSPEIGFYDPVNKDVVLLLRVPATKDGKLTLLSSPTSGNPTVVGTQTLGKDPVGYAFDTLTSFTYVVNRGSNTVTAF